jgi:hypothetical protein
LSLYNLSDVLFDVVFLLVFKQSPEDVVPLGVLSHQVIDHCHVVPQKKLIQVIFATENFFLQIFN